MHERPNLGEIRIVTQLFGNQVLDRLDVMVRGLLDFLDAPRAGLKKVIGESVKIAIDDRRQRSEVVDLGAIGEELDPAHFREGAQPDQAEFAEQFPVGVTLRGVTAVEWGDGGQGR